jgi:GT2 family glycosyltransferase
VEGQAEEVAPVAVAVVSWDTRELLRRCLASLGPSVDSGLASVWVVDTGSSDGSAAMVRADFPWAGVIEPGENLGYGRAVNLVAARTCSAWIAAANADVAVEPGALERLLAAARRRTEIGAIAPALQGDDGPERSVHRLPTLATTALAWAGLERDWDLALGRDVGWAHGAFLLIRRRAFEQVGGFDPRQWLFAEDVDLCWRLRRSGWAIRYEPEATVLHAGGAATAQAAFDRPARELEALYGWMARRRGWPVTRGFALLSIAALTVRLPVFGLLALIRGAPWTAKLERGRRELRNHLAGLRRRSVVVVYR